MIDVISVDLIGFSNASSSAAYSCCLHLWVTRPTGKVTMHLLFYKSRINFLQGKNKTVPHLRHNAAIFLSWPLLALLTSKPAGCHWLYVNTKDNPAWCLQHVVVLTFYYVIDSKYKFNFYIDLPVDYQRRIPDQHCSATRYFLLYT